VKRILLCPVGALLEMSAILAILLLPSALYSAERLMLDVNYEKNQTHVVVVNDDGIKIYPQKIYEGTFRSSKELEGAKLLQTVVSKTAREELVHEHERGVTFHRIFSPDTGAVRRVDVYQGFIADIYSGIPLQSIIYVGPGKKIVKDYIKKQTVEITLNPETGEEMSSKFYRGIAPRNDVSGLEEVDR